MSTSDRIDESIVAEMLIAYCDWITDNGGTPPDELLARSMTLAQRRLLLDRMDDVAVLYSITGTVRASVWKATME